MTDLESQPEALYYQAQAFEQLKRWPSALQNYTRIHFFFPLYPEGDSVEQRLAQLGEQNPGLLVDIPQEWRIDPDRKPFRWQTLPRDFERPGTARQVGPIVQQDCSISILAGDVVVRIEKIL